MFINPDTIMKPAHSDVAPALVLGLSPTGLAVVQSLGLEGIAVYGADLKKWEIGRYSQYCIFQPELSRHLLPDRALPALTTFRKRFEKDPVLYIADDYIIDLLAPHFPELKNN